MKLKSCSKIKDLPVGIVRFDLIVEAFFNKKSVVVSTEVSGLILTDNDGFDNP